MQEMKQEKQRAHRQEIEYFLRRMQHSPEQLQHYHLLQGGISGATTYRLRMTDKELVCKITRTNSEPHVFARAFRELSFYLTLAPHLPVRVPEVVGYVQDERGIALLLTAYQPSPPASQWQEQHYLEIARQLGRLHALFWKRTTQLAQYSWLRTPEETDSVQQVQEATTQWQALQEDLRFAPVIPNSRFQRVNRLLSQMPQVESLLINFPLTLYHGDCHGDNVLRDGRGEVIWADWQEVGLGLGPADVSFFMQRAFFADGTVPHEAMLKAYHQQLEEQGVEGLPFALLQPTVDALEVRSWLLQWPPYLGYASPERLSKVLERVDLLSRRLHLE